MTLDVEPVVVARLWGLRAKVRGLMWSAAFRRVAGTGPVGSHSPSRHANRAVRCGSAVGRPFSAAVTPAIASAGRSHPGPQPLGRPLQGGLGVAEPLDGRVQLGEAFGVARLVADHAAGLLEERQRGRPFQQQRPQASFDPGLSSARRQKARMRAQRVLAWLERGVQTDLSVFHPSARPGSCPFQPKICLLRGCRQQADSGYAAIYRTCRDSRSDRRAMAQPASVARIGPVRRDPPLAGSPAAC